MIVVFQGDKLVLGEAPGRRYDTDDLAPGEAEELTDRLSLWLRSNDYLRESTLFWTLDELLRAAHDFYRA